MAKLNKKDSAKVTTLPKVDKKSKAIQKPNKADQKPVKNLKNVAAKVKVEQKAKGDSPKKQQKPKKKLQKKTTPSGGSPIVPKKAKKTQPAAGKTKNLVSREDVAKCVTAFRAALKVGLAEKKAMLDPDFKYILQLCSFKVPRVPERLARTTLKHSLVEETDDVCLFVKDLQEGDKRDWQPTIDFYREKLDAAGVTNIKTIIPMAQVTADYKQHEMLRKLCSSYDCFLTDGRIAPKLVKRLGKTFVQYKKTPTAVRLNHAQLKDHLLKSVKKVAYMQTNSGDSVGIPVAKHGFEDEQVVDNVLQVLDNMKTEFPGGWANIKRVFLRPAINLSKSSVPVYVNASSGENVPVPVVVGPRQKSVTEKQKQLNALLPDGMVMTSKGELAMVAGRKRPAAEATEEAEKPAVEKKKKKQTPAAAAVKEEPVAKKQKKEKVKVEEVEAPKNKKVKREAVETEDVTAKGAAKKGKKEKVAAAPVAVKMAGVVNEKEEAPKKSKKVKAPETTTEEEKPAAAAKKAKKEKQSPAAPPSVAAAAAAEDTKPGKKSKKKAAAPEPADGDLSREVSELWEQIKNESTADLDGELDKMEKESAAELGDDEPQPKKKNKPGKKPAEKKKAKK